MNTLSPKIAIIGAGQVGSTFAYALMISGLAREIVIIDRNEKKAQGECMDLNHGLSLSHPANIYAAGYEGCSGADIVVITAGASQKPGQTRLDLVHANVAIFKDIISNILKYADNPILLVVTNPVDILTYVTLKLSGLAPSRVLGSGTVLDTARFKFLISEHCRVDPRNVHAYIIGEHGDSELPVWSNARIGGMVIERYCSLCSNQGKCDRTQVLNTIFENVKNAAYKIIECKGATYYAIGLSLVRIIEAIIRDEHSLLSVSTLINNYYGIQNICLSLPSVVGNNGVERFLNIELSDHEQALLKKSADTLQKSITKISL